VHFIASLKPNNNKELIERKGQNRLRELKSGRPVHKNCSPTFHGRRSRTLPMRMLCLSSANRASML
jgi:hypothetical protein